MTWGVDRPEPEIVIGAYGNGAPRRYGWSEIVTNSLTNNQQRQNVHYRSVIQLFGEDGEIRTGPVNNLYSLDRSSESKLLEVRSGCSCGSTRIRAIIRCLVISKSRMGVSKKTRPQSEDYDFYLLAHKALWTREGSFYSRDVVEWGDSTVSDGKADATRWTVAERLIPLAEAGADGDAQRGTGRIIQKDADQSDARGELALYVWSLSNGETEPATGTAQQRGAVDDRFIARRQLETDEADDANKRENGFNKAFVGKWGTLTLTWVADNDLSDGDSSHWTFSYVQNDGHAEIDPLNEGEAGPVETFMLMTKDRSSKALQTLKFAITGKNDTPVVVTGAVPVADLVVVDVADNTANGYFLATDVDIRGCERQYRAQGVGVDGESARGCRGGT